MWVFTPFGILMPGLRPAHTVPEGDPRLLQVRARRMKDLEILRAKYLPGLGDIIQLPHTDYQFRAYCTHEQWANALAQMAMDIDYVKFKEQTERKYSDKKLHDLYTSLWYRIFEAFPNGSSYDQSTRSSWSYSTPTWGRGRKVTRETSMFSTGDALIDEDVRDLLDDFDWSEVPPARRPNGTLDHSTCDHGNSKNAKRRCSRKWNK